MTQARPRILLPAVGVAAVAAVAMLAAATNAAEPMDVAAWLSLSVVALAGALTVILLAGGSRTTLAAGVAAAVWAAAAAASGVSAFATTQLPAAPGTEPTLGYFIVHTVPGRAWLWVSGAALICSIVVLVSRRRGARSAALAVSIVGMVALGSVAVAPPLAEGTAAQLRTGRELPPEPTLRTWVGAWEADAFMVSFVGAVAIVWAWRMIRNSQANARLAPIRILCGVLGIALLAWITLGFPEQYFAVLFSAHLLQLLCAVFIVGPLLAWGGAVTFGPAGAGLLSGRPIRVVVGVSGLVGAYLFSPILRAAVADPTVHTVTMVVGVAAGAALVVAARGATRRSWMTSVALLLGALSALAGVLHFGSVLLVAEWFGGLGREWSADALADQRSSAVLVWVAAIIPVMLVWVVPTGFARVFSQRNATIVGSPASVKSTS